jgi:hypothetical protein
MIILARAEVIQGQHRPQKSGGGGKVRGAGNLSAFPGLFPPSRGRGFCFIVEILKRSHELPFYLKT